METAVAWAVHTKASGEPMLEVSAYQCIAAVRGVEEEELGFVWKVEQETEPDVVWEVEQETEPDVVWEVEQEQAAEMAWMGRALAACHQ